MDGIMEAASSRCVPQLAPFLSDDLLLYSWPFASGSFSIMFAANSFHTHAIVGWPCSMPFLPAPFLPLILHGSKFFHDIRWIQQTNNIVWGYPGRFISCLMHYFIKFLHAPKENFYVPLCIKNTNCCDGSTHPLRYHGHESRNNCNNISDWSSFWPIGGGRHCRSKTLEFHSDVWQVPCQSVDQAMICDLAGWWSSFLCWSPTLTLPLFPPFVLCLLVSS